MRQTCVVSPWLFNKNMESVISEMNVIIGDAGVEIYVNDGK